MATSDPSTTTFDALVTSWVEKNVPYLTGHDRISGNSTSVPWMRVCQFWLPAMIWLRVETLGATYWAVGTSSRMARASSTVSVFDAPDPWRTPIDMKLPDITLMMLVPAD